jgi:hypothetical protein
MNGFKVGMYLALQKRKMWYQSVPDHENKLNYINIVRYHSFVALRSIHRKHEHNTNKLLEVVVQRLVLTFRTMVLHPAESIYKEYQEYT